MVREANANSVLSNCSSGSARIQAKVDGESAVPPVVQFRREATAANLWAETLPAAAEQLATDGQLGVGLIE